MARKRVLVIQPNIKSQHLIIFNFFLCRRLSDTEIILRKTRFNCTSIARKIKRKNLILEKNGNSVKQKFFSCRFSLNFSLKKFYFGKEIKEYNENRIEIFFAEFFGGSDERKVRKKRKEK